MQVETSTKQLSDWGKFWVALRLLEIGWRVKLSGQSARSLKLIASHPDHGDRTIGVSTIGRNKGPIDLGPHESFAEDFVVFVFNPMKSDATANVYSGNLVRNATTTEKSSGPFAVDHKAKKSTGKVHVWTRPSTKAEIYFPSPANHEAWAIIT